MDFAGKLAAIHTIEDENRRAWSLVALLPHLPDELKTQAIQDALATTREIKDNYDRAWVLAHLVPYLNDELKTQVLQEALAIVREIKEETNRYIDLARLAPYLNDDLKIQALIILREIKDESTRAYALLSFARHIDNDLNNQIFLEAFTVARKIKDEGKRAHTLRKFIELLRNDDSKIQVLKKAAFAALENKDEDACISTVAMLVPNMNHEIKNHIPQKSLAGLQPQEAYTSIIEEMENDGNWEDGVFFRSYHPREGSVESWHALLVYTHINSALAKVLVDVKRFSDQIKWPKETTSKSSTPIARGTELTIVPVYEGVIFNPERVSFKWLEDFHRADFRFKADKSLSGDASKGQITIYVGPLIIGTLKFAMLFNEKENAQPVLDHEEHAKMYGKDDVFISYSRKDTEVARVFKTILAATGMDVFLDVDNLRSGQLWEKELLSRIERAGIFQMFWSENYSQSKNCRMEW